MVNSQVSKARIAVELRATQEHAHPGFLEKVLGQLAIACEIEQVAQQPMLILENQLVQNAGVVALRPSATRAFSVRIWSASWSVAACISLSLTDKGLRKTLLVASFSSFSTTSNLRVPFGRLLACARRCCS